MHWPPRDNPAGGDQKLVNSKFTERAKLVLKIAREEALRFMTGYIRTEHLLLGIAKLREGVASIVLSNLGIDFDELIRKIESIASSSRDLIAMTDEKIIPYDEYASNALTYALEESRRLGHNYVGTEHLLLGILRERRGLGSQILLSMGLDMTSVRDEVINVSGKKSRQNNFQTKNLDNFSVDLTQLAREGKLDPVIGRENEIERIIHVLARRRKNNPVLIGEPGVGKTAIVEGLAQRIANKNVPDVLVEKRVLQLDIAAIVAGTKYRGQFEERMKSIIVEAVKAPDVILFIDELHTVIGAGSAEGSLDASSMLKPVLARGEIQIIGATTFDEYRKYIEKDGALERRFQPVMVDEPSVEETINILKGLSSKYAVFHGVKYTEEALELAARLSDRYITDRYLPDKAIDVIDEAGAMVKLAASNVSDDLIERYRNELDRIRTLKRLALEHQEYEQAARLRDREREITRKIALRKKTIIENMRNLTVTPDHIMYIVSKWTGIPLNRMDVEEGKRLLQMEKALKEKIIGQDEAIHALARAIRRSKAGIKDPHRPIGSFIFLGPTGVGKTALAKALAEFLFGETDALIQIDMSEYMEKFSVSRLIGAPPGYVGYEEGGQLTERVRRRPYSVVLFDEFEKAHPDIFNILLQILEEGVVTDSVGRKVNFRETVIILTSNIGTRFLNKARGLGFSSEPSELSPMKIREYLSDELKRIVPPELLNRIDDIIIFNPLGRDELRSIVDVMIGELKDRLAEKRISIELSTYVKDFLIDKGYNPQYGARPLRRAIRRYIEDPLSEAILAGKIKEGDTILAVLEKGQIQFIPTKEKEQCPV